MYQVCTSMYHVHTSGASQEVLSKLPHIPISQTLCIMLRAFSKFHLPFLPVLSGRCCCSISRRSTSFCCSSRSSELEEGYQSNWLPLPWWLHLVCQNLGHPLGRDPELWITLQSCTGGMYHYRAVQAVSYDTWVCTIAALCHTKYAQSLCSEEDWVAGQQRHCDVAVWECSRHNPVLTILCTYYYVLSMYYSCTSMYLVCTSSCTLGIA